MSACRACARKEAFNTSKYGACITCRERVIGKGNKRCRLCNKVGPSKEFRGNLHSRCIYLRDKRIASGGVLVTINQGESK